MRRCTPSASAPSWNRRFWLGQPRTNVGSFTDYFDGLIGWERFRASQFGIRHHCTIALNPKEANDPRCVDVLDVLPRYLAKDGVVAVGEVVTTR
jgi:predicted metal-dependent TIM-barrel fold hydrolase